MPSLQRRTLQKAFSLLASALALAEKGRLKLAARAEIRLMRELGYEPELYHCLNCRGGCAGHHILHGTGGGVVPEVCSPGSGSVRISNGVWELMKKL